MKNNDEQNLRTASLIGSSGVECLKNSSVAVFGIGGVGSYVVESLARSGVGTLYLFDHDIVAKSNCNRQLIALHSTIGALKTSVSAARCKDINPEINVIENPVFVTKETLLPFEKFDFIIDAIDNVTAKLHLIEQANLHGVPMISVMGTGNKLDPSKLQIGDIYSTKECPLAKVMRSQLRKRKIPSLPVVWSNETAIVPQNMGECRSTGRTSPGSMAFVPGCAGLMAGAYAVKILLKKKKEESSD